MDETEQINQYMNQEMFEDPIPYDNLPKDGVISYPHRQYLVKQSGVHCSQMCCNG